MKQALTEKLPPVLAYCGERVDAACWPRLAAYIDRVHARPSYKAIIEEEKASLGR